MEQSLDDKIEIERYLKIKNSHDRDWQTTLYAGLFVLLAMATQATIAFTDFPHNLPARQPGIVYELKEPIHYSFPGYAVSYEP